MPRQTFPLLLNIAGVCFRIQGHRCRVRAERDAHRKSFRRPWEGIDRNGVIEVAVEVRRGSGPDLGAMQEIFAGTRSWHMLKDGRRRAIVLRPEGLEQPFWVAETDESFRQVTVHCSDRFTAADRDPHTVANPVRYPLDQILLMHVLAPCEGLLIHAAGAVVQGRVCLFPGRSGAGKSEIARQFIADGRFPLLSDDRIVIRRQREGWRAFGTPWPGDAGVAASGGAPLGGIFFLRHGSSDRILPLPGTEAFERILPVSSIPWYDRRDLERIMETCEKLTGDVPVHELHFRPHPEVVRVLEACDCFPADPACRPAEGGL